MNSGYDARDAKSVTARFVARFGSSPRVFRAPARVNIIGEHTDYNYGLVMPTTTALYTWAAAAPRDDRQVHVFSENMSETTSFEIDDIQKNETAGWGDYVKGVASVIQQNGADLRGANIYIDTEIPIGRGLSSSASLELAFGTALLDVARQSMQPAVLAELCQEAEEEFAGVSCGIMDQLAVACCEPGKAMLLDCRSFERGLIRIPRELGILIVDSGVKRRLPEGSYNDRTRECSTAVAGLRGAMRGISTMRDLDIADLDRVAEVLPETLYRRCRHVVTENQRTLDAADALAANDLQLLGELLRASHTSLRDDFEVSCTELDSLASIANDCNGVLGARMVGAGFGGCIIALIHAEAVDMCREEICANFARETGKMPWSHVASPAHPAGPAGANG